MSKKANTKSSVPVDANINVRYMLEQMITQHSNGNDGIFIAIREAINNSVDASATEIKITYGEISSSDRKSTIPAIIISDNGTGFNQKGIQSVMGYGNSSKFRDDITTIGVNGTGLKSFLGLGELNKTQITILTVSQEIPNCTQMNISFEYLVGIAENTTKAEEHMDSISVPTDWEKDIKRSTGTTLILTGFDKKKVMNAESLIQGLGEHVTPRALALVTVLSGKKWMQPQEKKFQGKFLEFVDTTDSLGTVNFQVWYGGNNGEWPMVCGPINAILPLDILWKKLQAGQKVRTPKIWKTISGYIYVEKANYFRQHDGSFNDKFYNSQFAEDFVKLLVLVGEMLEKDHNSEVDQKSTREKSTFIERVVDAARQITPLENVPYEHASSGNISATNMVAMKDVPIDLHPRRVKVYVGKTTKVTLINHGTTQIDLSTASWRVDDQTVCGIKHPLGQSVSVAGKITGGTSIDVTGDFGTHTIEVIVEATSTDPFVNGPKYIEPGDVYSYELLNFSKDSLWEISKYDVNDFMLIPNPKESRTVNVKISDTCPNGKITLSAFQKGKNGQLIAQKTIFIDKNGAKKQKSVIQIGKKQYLLTVGNTYADTIAQLDTSFNTSQIPEIVINPLHPRIRTITPFAASEHILSAIANVAFADQIVEGTCTLKQMQGYVESFIISIKNKVYEK